ncbi:Uma2 family endonuclease [Actinokineospora sp. HUAS TT18]|uniref:Uma2 family endonuclease n=1 Tax=Actinokineospora sp. HUAS TT18 TaxID=3447451 RepID=UPI003F51D13C
MVAEMVAHDDNFDPLADLYGRWTTELADVYLPIPQAAPGTSFECVDGRLIMSPYEGSANVNAAYELHSLFRGPARAAGYRAYGTLNIVIRSDRWIQPDLVILREPIRDLTWVPIENVLMAVEIISKSSRRRDMVDKPKLCADAGVPFLMRVDMSRGAWVDLLELIAGEYVVRARAVEGQMLESMVPFAMKFDPADLTEF